MASAKSKTAVKEKVPVDVAAIRKQIGGAKKEVVSRRIGTKTVAGDRQAIIDLLDTVAEEAGIQDSWQLKFRYGAYRKEPGARNSTWHPEGYVLVGERDYTDEELAREGDALVKRIEKQRERDVISRKKKVAKMNALARELGLPTVE